ncbi:Histidine kinase [Amphibacillus marinus]|uniref:Histidine kinase n=1 Tax=Amphibacillus marinus TaxID=872970 RepID=A0A1H8L4Q5_9BACI|nr:histidine kinase [Amphibacillus marinus]SEO00124.1 Histidine kinase [Amphibacillus marinus]
MKLKRFEAKIRVDILKFSFKIITLMIIITIITVSFFNYNMRNYRLNNTLDHYSSSLKHVITTNQQELYAVSKDVFIRFLTGESDSRNVFSSFYSFNARQQMKSDLLVFDEALALVLHTNPIFETDYALFHFLSIVIDNEAPLQETGALRVYQSNQSTYLLYVLPIIDQAIIGYAVSVIDGREFQLLREDTSTNYVIYDQYDNVLSASSTSIVHTTTGKLNLNNDINHKETRPFSNITITAYVSNQSYAGVFFTSLIVLAILSLFISLQTYIFSKKASTKMGHSLYLLYDQLMQVSKSPSHRISIKTEDEFETLAENINKVLAELQSAHDRNIKLSELNLESERRKLEAQFHPHFLANTLETIRSAIYVDTSLAEELLTRMNDILRYSISEKRVDLPLQDDLVYIENYLIVNQIRYEDFTYKFKIDHDLKNLRVPKLLLLPLIENSLKYGFKFRRDLKMLIAIHRGSHGDIIIRVIDNGGNLSSDQATQLNTMLTTTTKPDQHHGLINTKQRLSLMYEHARFVVKTKCRCTIIEIRMRGGHYV